MLNKQLDNIQAVVQNYFEGIYNGDAAQLNEVFYSGTLLFGDIKGVPYFKTVTDYIDGVKSRKSPKELGEEFKMEILSIEKLGDNAIVKAQLLMLGYNYFDFLSLAKINEDWKIVNKLFTHVE